MKLLYRHKYTLLRLTRLLLAPLYTFFSFFIKTNNNIVITAQYNNQFTDNSKALFEILVNHPDYKNRVYFVINDLSKKDQLNKIYPGKFISNKSFKEVFFILQAGYWFCSAMELPLAIFLQRYRRHVVHLGHGMLIKKVGLIENKLSWYKALYYRLVITSFSYTIATTSFFRKHISKGFGLPENRVIITPQPKTFLISNPKPINNILSNHSLCHILYAPTWRPYGDVQLFPFNDFSLNDLSSFLIENNIHIWLRLHPSFDHKISDDLLSLPHIHLFSSNNYTDINSYLSYFSALITDYSSLYYDFLTLQRPVLFLDYDLDKYNSCVGVIDDYEKIKAFPTTTDYSSFKKKLLSICNTTYDLTPLYKVNQLVNFPAKNNEIPSIVIEKLKL